MASALEVGASSVSERALSCVDDEVGALSLEGAGEGDASSDGVELELSGDDDGEGAGSADETGDDEDEGAGRDGNEGGVNPCDASGVE